MANKIFLIIGREYFTRVKKKSFLLTTILIPIVIMAFYIGIIAIAVSDSGSKNINGLDQIAIIDKAGLFNGKVDSTSKKVRFTIISNESEQDLLKTYQKRGYDAFLFLPPFQLDSPSNIVLHSSGLLGHSTHSEIEDLVNNSIVAKRLEAQGITPEKYKSIASDVTIKNQLDTKEGSKSNIPEVGYFISMACGILIYMMMLIYGTQVMRGVMEEKMSRIAEVMVSSVKPFQLMMGKIVGIGAVGLTQFAIWIIIAFLLQSAVPLILPDVLEQAKHAGQSANLAVMNEVLGSVASLPILKIIGCFIFYFLGGYLTYAAMFAAIGSVVSDDQQDTQQLVFPVMMPIILGFMIMIKAADNPYSNLVIFGSYFPLTSPIVMMGRITFDIPGWELLVSMLLLAGCFVFITWIASRIYKTGILMYGKKLGWKELIKWGFRR